MDDTSLIILIIVGVILLVALVIWLASINTTTVTNSEPDNPPGPLPPYIPHYNTNNNYLNIKVDTQNISNNYFMVVGDWGGATVGFANAQKAVAEMMISYYNDNPGKNLLFIAVLGDNFYWTGQDGTLWDSDWYNIYDKKLTNVPWFPVMGNHDWGNSDPWCLCPENNPKSTKVGTTSYMCHQLNSDKGIPRPDYTNNYQFPDFCYHYSINELDFELIAMSTDYIDSPNGLGGDGIGIKQDGQKEGAYYTNVNCQVGKINVTDKLKTIYDAGINILIDRAKNTTNKNILITNHYSASNVPSDNMPACENFRNIFISNSKQSDQTVICSGGHVHSTGCLQNVGGVCLNILAGGGGGCCTANPGIGINGFYIIKFDNNKKMITEQLTYPYKKGVVENHLPIEVPDCHMH